MNSDIKSGVGFIIPLGAIIGFFTALFLGEHLLSICIAIAGILIWFLYMVIMESSPPLQMELFGREIGTLEHPGILTESPTETVPSWRWVIKIPMQKS